MCGRFTLTTDDYQSVAEALDADFDPEDAASWKPRYNIAPTDPHPVLVAGADGRRKLVRATWGLVSPRDKDKPKPPVQINARAETVATRGYFRHALLRLRCAVVADGFYEWHGDKKARRAIRFHKPEGGLLTFAGIALPWRHPETGETITRFAIITTVPNLVVAELHDRMPAVLAPYELDAWLDPPRAGLDTEAWIGELRTHLHAAPDDLLVGTPASPRVNDVKNDDPACLAAEPELW